MDKYFVCILLCIIQRLSVNGQMLVSHKAGVTITSSSQIDTDIWYIYNIVDKIVKLDPFSCKCCGATTLERNPWFKLDLGEEYNIQRIHVIGRQKDASYLYKMEIQLGTTKEDGTVLQGVDTSDINLRELDYTLTSPTLARFITLRLRYVTDYFVICELYVYAVCTEGKYGPDCEKPCGKCKTNETCDHVTGACSECLTGYQSPLCQECQAGNFGRNCKQRCGMCQDGDVCDIYTGECPSGCTDEYKGSQCSQEINQDTSSSSDTSISLPVFIGSLIAVIVVNTTIVIGLVSLFYRKRLNKKGHRASKNEDTSIPLPNTPSHFDILRSDNPNGESTYYELS